MEAETTLNIKALGDLLIRQKDAIRRGDLMALSVLAEPMEKHLERLARLPAGNGSKQLDRLKQQAEENRHLLGAVLQGVQAANGRMRDIVGVARELKTYDSRGKKSSVSFAPGKVERHA